MTRVVELPIPAAVEAERVLLGAILNDADQLLPVLDILPPVTGDGCRGDVPRHGSYTKSMPSRTRRANSRAGSSI
jgi:hypothetical protein